MTVRVNKSAFNIREKLSELERPIGVKGNELMRAETAQDARDLVSAGRKNLIINGDMRIAQRATTYANVGGSFNYYTLDRWQIRSTTHSGRYTMSQSTDNPGEGFSKSLKFEVTTADTSVAAGEYAGFSTRFEGQDVQQFAFGSSKAKPLTLSFWVKSSVTGTYGVFFANWWATPNGRLINRTFTINSPNTWEKKILTIPGDTDSTNSIADDSTAGMEIGWMFSAGTTYNDGTPGDTWHNTASTGRRHYGHEVNFANTLGNTFYITGIQLEIGNNATEFEHRSYGEELQLCKRYFQKFDAGRFRGLNAYPNVSLSSGDQLPSFLFPVQFRTTPTMSPTTATTTYDTWAAGGGITREVRYTASSGHVLFQYNSTDGGTQGNIPTGGYFRMRIDDNLEFSAEL